MKKITISLGLLGSCLLLAACSNGKTTTGSNQSKETTTLGTTTTVDTTTVAPTTVNTTTVVPTTTVNTTTVAPTTTVNTTTVVPTTTVNTTTVAPTTTVDTTTVDTTTVAPTTTVNTTTVDTTTVNTTTVVPTTTDEATTTSELPIVLKDTEIIMVGDSTMCSFSDSYYYPRYGYGTQMSNYFDSKAKVTNLAISGRSSLSFINETAYQTMLNNLDEGDYLVIGFGHNDEKSDDLTRFRSCNYSSIDDALNDENSFASSLYNNYIKKALDKGATPILATPITRLDSTNNYTGSVVHNTSNGNYTQTIIDLAEKYDLTCIDLTKETSEEYKSLGYNEAIYYHAMTKGAYDTDGTTIVPVLSSVDTTHINIYGAKFVSYEFATLLGDTDCYLKNYVKADIEKPTKENDLVENKNYVPLAYTAVDWSSYKPTAEFTTKTTGIYGTAFGDTGGSPASKGFVAKEAEEGVFSVGQGTNETAAGKITSTSFGFAYAFKQIAVSDNYTITAEAKVTKLLTSATKQVGFGLMIRDDCYTPVKDASITSNCICASVYNMSGSGLSFNFSYENDKYVAGNAQTSESMYSVDSTAKFTIVRNGQNITITTDYNGKTYTNTYIDFDLQAIDFNNYYLGMFATRGTIVEFSNVTYTYNGEYTGA